MSVRSLAGCPAPVGKIFAGLVVGQKPIVLAQSSQHVCQHLAGQLDRQPSAAALQGNPNKTKLGDRRGVKERILLPAHGGDPMDHPLVIEMIRPAPGHQYMDIQEIVHGNSASSSFTSWVLRGTW